MSEQDNRFSEWMKAHLGVLNRIARAFAEPADQHDLLQELMLAVWKAAPSFRGDSAPVRSSSTSTSCDGVSPQDGASPSARRRSGACDGSRTGETSAPPYG